MKYNPEVHHRQSIRLKNYDYSKEGMYFVTICTKNRECILSKIVGAHDCALTELTAIGKIIEKEILITKEKNKNIEIHEYIVMPNHVHMIINIFANGAQSCDANGAQSCATNGAQSCAPTGKTVGDIIRGIKSTVSAQIGYPIWQRNYYEHIIRNEKELYKIIQYIKYNPINWENDKNYRN
ncbi:MAG: hypothetical protein LBL34_04920 [Clostridiales bacterium]|jgi:REP element-mobilizing transposase RayT|nr:hypothetical protein [Clostridiales bacterium]